MKNKPMSTTEHNLPERPGFSIGRLLLPLLTLGALLGSGVFFHEGCAESEKTMWSPTGLPKRGEVIDDNILGAVFAVVAGAGVVGMMFASAERQLEADRARNNAITLKIER